MRSSPWPCVEQTHDRQSTEITWTITRIGSAVCGSGGNNVFIVEEQDAGASGLSGCDRHRVKQARLLFLADQLVILRMRTEPEPNHVGLVLYRQRPVMQAHANRPEAPDFLEVQRRMPRVRLSNSKPWSARRRTSSGIA